LVRKKNPLLRILPLGGLGEIGLNCMVFEYEEEIIVIDCGVMFSDLQILGVEYIIPDMSYLKQNKNKIQGYLITHGHEDHIGALPFALKHHPAPIYCTPFVQKLIEAKLQEHNLDSVTKIKTFEPKQEIIFKNFKITPVSVNHSIIEALALFIETPVGKIVFTGDFKIDSHPYYGHPMDLAPFKKAGEQGVLLLMSDSTNAEREGHSVSEKFIYGKFKEIFEQHSGLIVVSVFASNIARIGQVLELAIKYNKKVALLGRSMEQNTRLAQESGYLKNFPKVLIPVEEIERVGRENCIVLSTGSQGESRSALVRLSNGEQKHFKLGEGDLVILSSKFIPGNEKAIGRMINSLFKQGANVLYEAIEDIHISGHAGAEELKTMLDATKPHFFIPIHGEYRHLVRHRKLALQQGVLSKNAVIATNGDVLELSSDHLQIIDHIEENRVLIEGEAGNDISKLVLKDRRKVAEKGIVFSIVIRNSVTGKILAGPDLISRGFLDLEKEAHVLENAKREVKALLSHFSKNQTPNLQEEIRIGLRRYFQAQTGKKPVVLPIILDV